MVVEPDCHAIPRPNRHEKAQMILTRSGRVHFQYDGYEVSVLTPSESSSQKNPLLGISSLPNVVFEKLTLRLRLDSLGQFNFRTSATLGT